jgi:formate hydrogenlyase subunit 3/multisubunit Na+/H+ antiporter MnhD subunit
MDFSLLMLAVAVGSALLSSVVSLGADRSERMYLLSFILLGISGAAALWSGIIALLYNNLIQQQLGLGLPWLAWHLRLDTLSGFFFSIVGMVTFAVSFYAPGYVKEFSHTPYPLSVLGVFTGLFIAGMLLVLLADDAYTFMVAWELMSLSSYFLVVYQHGNSHNRKAAFLYLLMAHVGGLTILLAFSVLANSGGGFTFDAMRSANISPLWANIAFGLGLFGFGMKAGLTPLHAWLPEAHPVAPSHISALMSGVMLKIAIYGLIRLIFDLLGTAHLHWSWGFILLSMGGSSAILGIMYALVQNDLKKLLAYSSIENIGIICMGLGLSILFTAHHYTVLGSLAMIATLFHAMNHALFKSLLFLSTGAVLHATHEQNLEQMGGLIHRMPLTALFFLIGALSISALPPFNGFASEWLIFQSALQAPRLESGVLRAMIPFSAALLAFTSALSASCFVKVYGVAFLGQSRTRHVRRARESSFGMNAAQGILAMACFILGIIPTHVVMLIENVPENLLGKGLPSAYAEGWIWLTPISAETASYAAPLVLLSIIVVWGLSHVLLHVKKGNWRLSIPWDCGFGPLNSRMQYTSTAFAQPLRRIFSPLWQIEEKTEETKNATLQRTHLRYQLQLVDRSWAILYQPIGEVVMRVARKLSYIQTGNIRIYLGYSFFTLLVLLWLIT